MKIYHTATQEDYDALMFELEEKGKYWEDSKKNPTYERNHWILSEENTYISENSESISIYDYIGVKKEYPYQAIIEYKARKDNINDKQDKLSPNHYKFGDMEVRHFLDRVFKYGEFDAVSAPYVSNAIEYICRAPRKEGIEDYKKALNNLKFLIEILEVEE
jgi:hypothetical protein